MNLSGRQLPPLVPHKRKQRDEVFDLLKPSRIGRPPPPKLAKPMPKPVPRRAAAPTKSREADAPPSGHASMLLAGFMAHEFLTKGTLFGELYAPAGANVPPGSSEAKKPSHASINWGKGEVTEPKPEPRGNKIRLELKSAKNRRYVEVSELFKNGAHIPGIVNPSQLVRLLHIQPDKK